MRLIELPATMSQNPSQSHRYLTEQTLILTKASEDCRMPGTCFRTDPTDQIPSNIRPQKNLPQTLQQFETIPHNPQNHHPQNHPQNHHPQTHHPQNNHHQNHHPQNNHPQKVINQLPSNNRPAYPPGIQAMPSISSSQKFHHLNPDDQGVAQAQINQLSPNNRPAYTPGIQAMPNIQKFYHLNPDDQAVTQAQRPTDFKDAQNDQNGVQVIGPEAFPLEIELENPGDSVLLPAFNGNNFCSCCCCCCSAYCHPSCYSWRPGFCSPACSGYYVLSPCR